MSGKEGEVLLLNYKCRSPNFALKRKPNYELKKQPLPHPILTFTLNLKP
ncbi:hypothetical protein SAMN05216323_102614 [Williamwhitmania taraxaci]|uniref:Uncharacterized protein n=1 Tax=Williamwhitmania taraxaci TaxID=1640674 RepID=A0A1G6KP20_9BACT|nr:hypothetical protein SAMN05216323_102614 [Williamwhitmania taraxaci]